MDFQICDVQRRRTFWNLLALPHMHRRRLWSVQSDPSELSVRHEAGERGSRQRFFLPRLGRWGPFLDLWRARTRIPTPRTRGDTGTVQLQTQRSWQKRTASWRGMYRRPWEAIRVPELLDLDANIVQRWALRPKKVWRRQNCQRVRHEHNAVWSPYSKLPFSQVHDARAWRWNRHDLVWPNWLDRVSSIDSRSTAAKLMERWLKHEPGRTVQVWQHECAAESRANYDN